MTTVEARRRKRRWLLVAAILALMLLFAVATPIIVLALGLQSRPLVTSREKPSHDDVTRVKQLLKENDPRRLKAGEVKSVLVTERDINIFLDSASSYAPGNRAVFARVDLHEKAAAVRLTLTLPGSPFGKYLNVCVALAESSGGVAMRKLKLGAVTVPGCLVGRAASFVHERLLEHEPYCEAVEAARSVKELRLNEGRVLLTYQWTPHAMERLKARGQTLLLPENERRRLRVYDERIARLSHRVTGRDASLTEFLSPMFQFAAECSASGQNPTIENRALILALTAYAMGKDVRVLLGVEKGETRQEPRSVRLYLLGRRDLAKHFLVSAALAASAGSGVANLIGESKELDDSRGGSGFSFADLAADRAGVKLAEIAIGSPRQARLLQQRMAAVIAETEYMPRVDRLPESIMELEFKKTYPSLDSEAYRMIEREIERRIAACPVYR